MAHKRRGKALIFNHENFQYLKKRRGTNKDRDNLRERFQDLGFEVNPHNDKSKKEVLEEIRKAAAANHEDANCFVCIFLTHGEEGQIYAKDDKIKIKEITDYFKGDQCKSLVGKIFIFQIVQFVKNNRAGLLQHFSSLLSLSASPALIPPPQHVTATNRALATTA
ncbi:caspase-6-like [Ictalurus punctatus]|uniref:Caspase-6-like n=1 Tax=Ictalurus punctatus TaxID=7998 RepID=A0A2D0QKG9_ICTPU|nr:caspase-6-like [Ictalurus punctatus]